MCGWRVLSFVVVLLALAGARPARAETSAEAADAVLEILRRGAGEGLLGHARRTGVSYWIVAERLLARGEVDAAAAVARTLTEPDFEELPGYVAAHRDRATDAGALDAFDAAVLALSRGEHERVLALLDGRDGPPGSVTHVVVALQRGLALEKLGRVADAHAAYRACGETAATLGWWQFAAWGFECVGRLAQVRGDARAALSAGERTLEHSRRRRLPEAEASALTDLSNARYLLGEFAPAEDLTRQALAIFLRLGNRRQAGTAYGNLGNIARRRGRLAESLRLQGVALQLLWMEGDAEGVARATGNLGHSLADAGRRAEALALHERSLALYRSLADRQNEARTLVDIGSRHQELGRPAEAVGRTQEGLAIARELGDRALEANALGNLGVDYAHMGALGKALSHHQLALKLKLELGLHADAALTLRNIGGLQAERGEYARALATLEEAERLHHEAGEHVQVARALAERAYVAQIMGLEDVSLDLGRWALDRQRALGDQAGAAVTAANLAGTLRAQGRLEEALTLLDEALADFRRLDMPVNEARAHKQRGEFLLGTDPQRAAASLREALALQESVGDRPMLADTRTALGLALSLQGKHAEARTLLDRAVREAEQVGSRRALVHALAGAAQASLRRGDAAAAREQAHRGAERALESFHGLGDEAGIALKAGFAGLYAVGMRAALALEDPGELAYFVESSRAGSLLESLDGREQLRHVGVREDLAQADEAATAAEASAAAMHQRALKREDEAAIRRTAADLAKARAASGAVRERIQREAKQQAALWYPSAATIEEIQGGLAAGEALVLYGVTPEESLALVLEAGAEPRLVTLGETRPVEEACAALALHAPEGNPAPAFAALRRLLVAPLALGKDVRRLLVSPDGPLNYVPFAAMVESLPLLYAPSGTTLVLLRNERQPRGEGVLALGDPDYLAKRDKSAQALYGRGSRLTTLPFTREEAQAVGQTVLLGADASEAGFASALAAKKGRWRAVHLACHGIVNPEQPMLSALALSPDAENDGYLTALDVMRLKVPADLAVLSACETATGRIVRGEGIVGLTRAFLFAGAPRVLCSLWPVDDAATRALMASFYAAWNAGAPADQALRAAQAAVRAKPAWAHPHYWAAWVLWGIPE